MILNIIFAIAMYPMILIVFYVMKVEAKPKNGVYFGVKLKEEWINTEEVNLIVKAFNKEFKRLNIIFAVIPVSFFLIPSTSISFTLWMFWLLGGIFGMMVPYCKGFYKLRNLKQEKGWRIQENTETPDLFVEIKSIEEIRRVKIHQFIPQILVSIACVGVAVFFRKRVDVAPFLYVVIIFSMTTLLFYGAAILMDRMKSEVISENSDVNTNYNRSRKNLWKNFWVSASIANTIYTIMLTISIIINNYFLMVVLWGSLITSFIIILLIVLLCKKLEKINGIYRKKQSEEVMSDDESLWIGGMLYNNPNDKHILVNKRIGIGSSINIGTFWGKTLTGFCVLLLGLMIPITCFLMILVEFTPMRLSVYENELVARQIDIDYRISVDDIKSLELITELPRHSKVSGTGMDNLEKGTYYIRDTGRCQFFLNPENEYFLHFIVNGTQYYMSASMDQDTLIIYQEICE